jgi:hypothetical protein
MKIERRRRREVELEGKALGRALREGLDALITSPAEAEKSAEQRLVEKRDKKRRGFRGHWYAYAMVNLGLMVMNLGTWLLTGVPFPWFLFVSAGWGIGFGIHALNHRAWLADNAPALRAAEAALGLPSPPPSRALPAGAARAALPAPADPLRALVAECQAAVEKAEAALLAVDNPAAAFEDAIARLHQGLENVEHLAEGAARIDAALAEIAPGGLEALRPQLEAADQAIAATRDDRLREVHHQNRTLLVARRAKVEALLADRERMLANARGFLLATENLRLDAARLGAGGDASAAALRAPLERLTDEVEILRKVEAELALLSAPR